MGCFGEELARKLLKGHTLWRKRHGVGLAPCAIAAMPIATGREGARSALRGFKVVCAGIPESFWDPSVSCGLPSLQHVHNITISQGALGRPLPDVRERIFEPAPR